jgi:predicted extracellular nuclease
MSGLNCSSGNGSVFSEDTVESDAIADQTVADTTPTPDSTSGDQTVTTDQTETGWTIAKIQDLPEGKSCHELADPPWFINHLYAVQVNGIIVASDKFDAYTNDEEPEESQDGYFVMDAGGGVMSGAVLVISRQAASNYQRGDVLDVEGNVEDFNCMTRITGESVEVVSTGADTDALDVSVGDLTDPATVESYEGVLVRLTNVTADEELPFGKYQLVGGLAVGDLLIRFELELPLQQNIESITGFINYSYGAYELVPRSVADISGPPPNPQTAVSIQDVQKNVEGLNCETNGDGLQANIHDITQNILIEGAIVVSPKFSTSNNLDMYYVSENPAVPYSGVMLTVPSAWSSDYQMGDSLDIEGKHVEFYCNSQVSADAVTASGSVDVPEPLAISAVDLTDPTVAESYEGVLVRVNGVTVAEQDEYDAYILSSGAYVDKTIWEGLELQVGGQYTSITGVVSYSYYHYRIFPRSAADLVPAQ